MAGEGGGAGPGGGRGGGGGGNPNVDLQYTKERKPRERITQACDHCVRRRRRCSGLQPCALCAAAGKDCVFSREVKKRGPPKGFRPGRAHDSGSGSGGDEQKPAPAKRRVSKAAGTAAGPAPTQGDVLANSDAAAAPDPAYAHHLLYGQFPQDVQAPYAGLPAGYPLQWHPTQQPGFPQTFVYAAQPAAHLYNGVGLVAGAGPVDPFRPVLPPLYPAGRDQFQYIGASSAAPPLGANSPAPFSPPGGYPALPTGDSFAHQAILTPPTGAPTPLTPSRYIYNESDTPGLGVSIANGLPNTGLTPTPLAGDTGGNEDYFAKPVSHSASWSSSRSVSASSASGGTPAAVPPGTSPRTAQESEFDRFRREMEAGPPRIPFAGPAVAEIPPSPRAGTETDFDRFRREMEAAGPRIPYMAPGLAGIGEQMLRAVEAGIEGSGELRGLRRMSDPSVAASFTGQPRSTVSDRVKTEDDTPSAEGTDSMQDGGAVFAASSGSLPYLPQQQQPLQPGFEMIGEDGLVTIVSPGAFLSGMGLASVPDYFTPAQPQWDPPPGMPSPPEPSSALQLVHTPRMQVGSTPAGEVPSNPSLFSDLPELPPFGVITQLVLNFTRYMDTLSTVFHRSFWDEIHLKPPWLLFSMAALVAPMVEDLGPRRFAVGAGLLERARRMLVFVGGSGGREAVMALFFCGVATATSWKAGSGPVTDGLMTMAVNTARQLGLNHEDEEEGGRGAGRGWIEREMDRRVWWTVFMMDKIGMVLSDRPPLIPSDSAHPHLPLPEALWAQPPAPDGTYLEPIGANIPAAYMTLPDHDLLSQPDWRGWSEWGLVIMIHRALGEVVRWLQFCAAHRVDPYTAPSEQEKLHVRLARKQAVEMFREVLGFADTVYSRLPGYYAFLESAPELFLDPAAPGIAVPFERRAEAAHLLIYLHTSYALLFAPKVPDPESPSTRMWMKHQPLFGIPCGPSAPAERGGPAEFPFPMEPQWLAEGPDARLKPGAYCPSPAAQCHFHTQRVSHILQALLEKGGDRVMQQLPPFVMWCGSQTFFFRYLLANFTYAKLVATTHAGDHAGAVRKAIADTEEHLRIMGPLSRRWKAADASQKHIAHMLAEAAGGMVINENAVFSAVGIIHEAHGKTKVDRVIEGLEEVHDDGN